jgi:metallo-beta-lactamase family protein
MHELEVNGKRHLLDCGLYQGRRKEGRERNSSFPFPPSSVAGVFLSHAHIDHSGNLPTLVRKGFHGPIYTTPATKDLCAFMLRDAAFIQEKDAEFLNKRSRRRRSVDRGYEAEEIEPLYTMEDADKAIALFRGVEMHQPLAVPPGLTYETYDAGHMLGSTAIMLKADGISLVFSGDVGRARLPITRDPEPVPPADYLILESTYGDRLHKDPGAVSKKLADIVNRTCARGGKLIVPSFAVGRAQAILVLLIDLMESNEIPTIPVFLDSPLAIDVSGVFRGHEELWDEETKAFFARNHDPDRFRMVHFVREASSSKALNDLHGPFVVISSSGMCEAGRVLHHLRNNVENPRNTVLITGFQAENTLGRKLIDGLGEVPIFGEPTRVRAEVAKINELSGHADQNELLEWMKPIAPGLKRVFLVHGEPSQSQALSAAIQNRYKLDVAIPDPNDSVSLT